MSNITVSIPIVSDSAKPPVQQRLELFASVNDKRICLEIPDPTQAHDLDNSLSRAIWLDVDDLLRALSAVVGPSPVAE